MKNVCCIDARLTFLIRELLNKIASFFINRMNAKMETIKQTKICPNCLVEEWSRRGIMMEKRPRARKGTQTDFHGLEILPKLPDIRPGFVEFIFNEVPSSDISRPPRNNRIL